MLHGPALEIVRRLMAERTEGKLFLNARGRPWKKFAICNRFDRLMLSFGMDRLRAEGIPLAPGLLGAVGIGARDGPSRCLGHSTNLRGQSSHMG